MTGPAFNPRAMLAVLDRHHVEYVVVGGYAANMHGAVRPTKDIDVAPATTTGNLPLLVTAGSVGRNVSEVLRVLDALQTDELCPCNWRKGAQTLDAAELLGAA